MSKTTKGYTKAQMELFKALEEGKELTKTQKATLTKFYNELGLTEQGKPPVVEQQSEEHQSEEQKELTLDNWLELTEEQKATLKSSILKSKYGVGGENIGIFPNLLGAKDTNTFILEEYGEKVEKPVRQQFLNNYKENGEIILLPLEVGNKIHYLTVIQPNKEITLDIWELLVEGKPYTKYTTYNKVGKITVKEGEYLITNVQTNKNKSWNNGKRLANLLNLYYDIKTMEMVKDGKPGGFFLKKDISDDGRIIFREISTNTHRPTGKQYSNIGEYLNRKLAGDLDLVEYI